MTGYGKKEITAAIEADPKLQEMVVRMIMDPGLREMADACDSSPEMRLVAKTLSTNMDLQKHVAALVGIACSDDVAMRRLDTAEERLIDATRKVKHATLQAWASNQAAGVEARVKAERTKGLHKDQKKPLLPDERGADRGRGAAISTEWCFIPACSGELRRDELWDFEGPGPNHR